MRPHTSAQFQRESRDGEPAEERIRAAFDVGNQKQYVRGESCAQEMHCIRISLAYVIFRMTKAKLLPLRQDENTIVLSLFCIYSGIYCFDICRLPAFSVFYSTSERKQCNCLHSQRLVCSL